MKNGFLLSIGVRNLETSITFYTKVIGFELMHRVTVNPTTEFAFLLYNNEIEIQLIERKDEALPEVSTSSISLSFQTDTIDDKESFLREQGFDTTVLTMPSGTKILPFEDPNGVRLSFIEE